MSFQISSLVPEPTIGAYGREYDLLAALRQCLEAPRTIRTSLTLTQILNDLLCNRQRHAMTLYGPRYLSEVVRKHPRWQLSVDTLRSKSLACDLKLEGLRNRTADPPSGWFQLNHLDRQIRRWMCSLIQLRGQENQLMNHATRLNPEHSH